MQLTLKLHPRQTSAFTTDATEVLYGGAAGGGKALCVDTPIATPYGWTTMGALVAGDVVYDDSGNECRVVDAFTPYVANTAWRLTFDDGSQIVADGPHKWLTLDAAELAALTRRTPEYRERRRANRPSVAKGNKSEAFVKSICASNAARTHVVMPEPSGTVRTTDEIVSTLRTARGRANHAIPVCGALQTPDIDFPLDPYLLGVWLGDGSKSTGLISCHADDSEVLTHFERAGYGVKHTAKYSWRVYGLIEPLRILGVLNNKHIPRQYMRASETQRLALLQGLMDTDGCVCRGAGVEFCNTNERIVDGLCEIARSLGYKISRREGRAKLYGKDCGPKWSVRFTPPDHVFRLTRKRNAQKLATRRTVKYRYIVSAEPVDNVKVRCIAVDSPSHLFLAGESMIPTHNSHLMRIALLSWCTAIPGLQCYLFRRTSDDLGKNHMEGPSGFRALLSEWTERGFVRFNEQKGHISFWNGAKIFLCHCQHEKDRFKYQGAEMHVLCCEEHEPVRLSDGSLVPVKDLKIGDSVLTLAGGRTVTAVGKRRLDRCVSATVFDSGGDVVGTQIHSETHKVLTPSGWVSYADMCGEPRQPLTCEPTGYYAENKSFQRFGTKYLSDSQFPDTQDRGCSRTVSQEQSLSGHQCSSEICAYMEQQYPGNCSESFEYERQEKQQPFSAFRFPVVLYSPDQQLVANGSIGDGYACAQSECIREDSLSRCDSSRGQCGESVLRQSGSAPKIAQPQACVETQNQKCQPLDGSDKAREHTRLDGLSYEHPYTGEELRAEEPVEFGSCEMSPCGEKWVIDLTVADENHYITKNRLVNKNCIDELTHFTDTIYRYLRGRVRLGGLTLPEAYQGKFPRIICGSNPGGIGHNWVKATFIDNAPPMEMKRMPKEEGGMVRQYIPAKLSDNPTLAEADPDYVDRLEGLGNAALVKAMKDGDWDIVAGGALDDVWDRSRHVLRPFEIPDTWRIDRSFDWGSSHPFAVAWWAESDGTEATLPDGSKKCWPRGTLFYIAEYYGWNGKPNEGCRMLAVEVARRILEIERTVFAGRRVLPGPADSSIFAAENGMSIGDDMARAGVRWEHADKSPGSRKAGLEAVRKKLKAGLSHPMEEPGLFIFDTCQHFIRTVPVMPRDERNPDDVDSDAEDHVFDLVRYKCLAPKRVVTSSTSAAGW